MTIILGINVCLVHGSKKYINKPELQRAMGRVYTFERTSLPISAQGSFG